MTRTTELEQQIKAKQVGKLEFKVGEKGAVGV